MWQSTTLSKECLNYLLRRRMVELSLRRYVSASLFFGRTGVFFTIEGFSEELAAHIVSFAVMDSEFVPSIGLHHKRPANGDPIPVIYVVWVLRFVWDDTVYLEWAQRKRFHLQGQ